MVSSCAPIIAATTIPNIWLTYGNQDPAKSRKVELVVVYWSSPCSEREPITRWFTVNGYFRSLCAAMNSCTYIQRGGQCSHRSIYNEGFKHNHCRFPYTSNGYHHGLAETSITAKPNERSFRPIDAPYSLLSTTHHPCQSSLPVLFRAP